MVITPTTYNACEVNIGFFKIKSYQNSSPEFKVIALPHLDFTTRFSNQTSNFPSIKLESINLDEFQHIKAALELQTKELETIPDGVTNYFQNPNVWTIVLYVAITLGFCLFLGRVVVKRRCSTHRTNDQAADSPHGNPREDIII